MIEKYCSGNDTNNCNLYGGLYQWVEAMQYTTTPGTKGICPSGWHIPTSSELPFLAVGNDGNALKAIGQGSGAGAGTNTSGFTALLAGNRNINAVFTGLGHYASFWSSTEYGAGTAYGVYLNDNDSDISCYDNFKGNGFSVRCVKD
jgi:uncharacterized protein (TIGR02145 family)